MANTLLPVDLYTNFNALISQETGGALAGANLSNAITVGQAAQLYGIENTLNKLSLAMGRTLIAVRPYQSNFGLIETTAQEYANLTRKISYFTDEFEESQDWNQAQTGTASATQPLVDGNSIDHYKIRKRYPLEVWFGGTKVLQKHYTRFRKQLKLAFSNAEDFARFYQGEAVQINNEIQMKKETQNRMMVLNFIAGILYQSQDQATTNKKYPAGMARNMAKEYNDKNGTTYTVAQLLTEHLKEFTAFFASQLKYQSDLLAKATSLYHVTPTNVKGDANKTLTLWRHTPKSAQRLMLLSPILYDIETHVYPTIFHDGYLKFSQYEPVPYWQSPTDPSHINVSKANVLDPQTGLTMDITPTKQNTRQILGIMYDVDALWAHYQQEDVVTTPVNAAGEYYNTFYHWAMNYHNDFTENAVVFYMEDVV